MSSIQSHVVSGQWAIRMSLAIAGRGLVVVSKNKDFPGNLEELSLSKEIRLDKRTHFLHGVGREYVF